MVEISSGYIGYIGHNIPGTGWSTSGLSTLVRVQSHWNKQILRWATKLVGKLTNGYAWIIIGYTIWLFNIAMGNHHF